MPLNRKILGACHLRDFLQNKLQKDQEKLRAKLAKSFENKEKLLHLFQALQEMEWLEKKDIREK